MGELADEIPPSIPPRPGCPSSSNAGMYSSSLGAGYSSFSGYGANNNMGRRVGYSSPYDPYSSYGYGGGGYGSRGYSGNYGYNQYGSGTAYNSPYNRFNQGEYGVNTSGGFLQKFEAAGRPAFEVIESLVNAVGSVSMLLESSHGTVFSLFRSVIGVADEFSRLKSHFSSLFAAFAFTKVLRWLRSKLSIRPIETAWETAQNTTSTTNTSSNIIQQGSTSNWPFIIFFSALIGAPYLTWKMLSSSQDSNPEETKPTSAPWTEGIGEHYIAEAMHDFDARDETELSMSKGQTLRLAPKHLQPTGLRGWLLASSSSVLSGTHIGVNSSESMHVTGLVPANRIKVLGRRTEIPAPHEKEKPDIVQTSK